MNLLLIEDQLRSLETFIQGCNENTKCVTYGLEDSFEELKLKIQNLDASSFNHVGFVFEDEGVLKAFVSNNPFISFDESGIKENLTTQFIKEIITIYNVQTLDFLACDLLLNPTWKSYFEYLQTQNSSENTSLTVRASNNKSGNLQYGGDWVLESTNENITSLYFNESIGQWSHLLGVTGSFNPYNSILLNETSNNIYICGMPLNKGCLLRAIGEYINSEYIFNKNIISISSTNDSFAFLTDEASNNLYVLGTNGEFKLGIGFISSVNSITNVTTNILGKKVIQVCLGRNSNTMYVITDESLNNLYVSGNNTSILGLGTTTSSNTLQRITYLNQKILMISSNASTGANLITDEPSNNVYYINNTTNKLFIKRDNIFSFRTTNSAADNSWTSICWSPELQLFCAVANSGSGNRVMTSPDGINWTSRTSAADNSWTSICWSPELQLFCAVANSGSGNRVMTSPDGINWTIRTSPANYDWTSICWSPELQLFCAVAGNGSGNRVMTSSDGITWTTRTSAADSAWSSICWSPYLQLFCAVAYLGPNTNLVGNLVMTSPDGINWTSQTSPAIYAWTSICWSPELQLFCAVSSLGSRRIMTSPDGINWTSRTSEIYDWTSVCWSPELQLFCAVARSGTGNRAMTSPDGINWTTHTTHIDNQWYSVCWSPQQGIFCAISNTGTGNRAMISYTYNATPLYNTKVIYIESNIATFLLTDEISNNFYVFGTNTTTNNIGLGSTTKVDQYTKVSSYSSELLNKKVEKIFMMNFNSANCYFALTNETSNNLYACGNNTTATPLIGIDNNNINTFQNVSNFSNELLNKKVIDLNVNINTTSVITDETSNNLYSTGSYNDYTFGEIITNTNYNTTLNTFKNVSLSFGSELLNKKVKLIAGYNSSSIVITNETPNNNYSNIFVNGTNLPLDNSLLYFKKMKYPINNIKFINVIRSISSLYAISDETSNNLYCVNDSLKTLTKLSFTNSSILNKKIIDMSVSEKFSYFLTDETSNNLYASSTNGTLLMGDGTSNASPNIKLINNNIINKKVIKIYNNDKHKCLLTDESINNFYVCGTMDSANAGSFGNGLSSGTYNVFTNVNNGDISGKKFIDVYCNGSGSSNFLGTFLISNETSNNLYACGKGFIGTTWNSTGTLSFKNIQNGIINRKKVLKVGRELMNTFALTDETSNNLYIGTFFESEFRKINDIILRDKTIIDIDCDNGFRNVFTNELINNIYVGGQNGYGQLGVKNKTNSDNFQRLTYLNNRSYSYVQPLDVSNVTVSLNNYITNASSQSVPVKYAPKNVNIRNNNKIFFPRSTDTSISIKPVQTTEAVQKYESVLNVTTKNLVTGYIKLEPAGTTFENHISLEFDVEPFIQPVVYFKSITDPLPLLIPSSNNSSNDVYYTANTSTGRVVLYTKHFSEAIVTQDQSTVNPPVGFVLSTFDTSLAMGVSGELFKQAIPAIDASAIAEYYVKTSDMRKVFAFQTDSRDINNIANQDVKYFVRKNQWPQGLVLNPCHAWVQTSKQIASSDKLGLIPDNRQLVKHDFIRYISKSLFNTHLGVDLFQNESELNYDLAYKGHNSAWSSIWNSLNSISDVSLNTTTYSGKFGTDPSYGYFLTNDLSNNSNICRQLLNQVISTAPGRIQDLTPYAIDISNGLFSVPLMDGDSISFKLTLQTAPNQHLLLNSATPIQPRSYQIRVNLRDTVTRGTTHQNGTNLIVNDSLPDSYLGSVPTQNLNTSYPANYV